MRRSPLLAAIAALALPAAASAQLQVVSTSPTLNAVAAVGTSISIDFDRPLNTATVTSDTFRVFGRGSGVVQGTYTFSNGDQTATLIPANPFSAGEIVFVNLSHDIQGADASSLRAAGYAFQFTTAVVASSGTFQEIDSFSNRTGSQTRIYGASATDFNGDRYLDLATINEVSADVRVFLNQANGSGLFGPMLPPEPIGVEASPNEPADFNNDGLMDLCVAAAVTESVWVLLGAGDGTFSSVQEIPVGSQPHGIAPLDVDGDGDLDIVNANVGSNDLSLLLNDGAGSFGPPTFFDGAVNGEYGLVASDMDGDGITDLVVAGRNGEEVVTMLGNGDGTFTAAGAPEDTGGLTWVVVVGDVNGDGDLDAVTANDGSGTVGVLLGQGDGTFAPATIVSVGSHVPGVDLGDLDGDGDLDMVVSSFGGGFWRRYSNDGTGAFTQVEQIPAPSNPSCAILLDSDNDGDLDMALTDEIADVVVLMENGATSSCPPAPAAGCRTPVLEKKGKLTLKNFFPDDLDRFVWRWTRGSPTPKADFGNPLVSDGYELCLYEDGALLLGLRAPAGGNCSPTKPCWKDIGIGFSYKDKLLTPDGVLALKLREGLVDPPPKISFKGKGDRLALPDLSQLTGVLDVRLHKTSGGVCFATTFTPPFKKNDGLILKAVSDGPPSTTTTTLPPTWSAIHSQVIGPTCGGCHGSSGGLGGLGNCNTALANLVDVPSTELVSMDRVEPGDPGNSWLMHKLDGTQGWFTAMCQAMFCGSQMPLGGALDEDVRDAIRSWIANGAVDDCP